MLLAWGAGDQAALDRLAQVVYRELRRVAARLMSQERPDHTLQATALVNEAYLRLVDITKVQWQNRAHFFAMSSRLMRRIVTSMLRVNSPVVSGSTRPGACDTRLDPSVRTYQ